MVLEKEISIDQFIRAIQRLPSDKLGDFPRMHTRTQKEHWLGWLGGYVSSGAYGRKFGHKRDA